MYLEHFHLSHSPFKEEADTEIFFPGAKREETCQSLVLDILSGKRLIKLIGREGSGKTLMCRLVINRLPAEFEVIYIDNPTGAFDDLLRIACLDLGMTPTGSYESANFFQELKRLLELRRAEKKKTVLIIDEAEKLFLATLERLVRNISENQDEMNIAVVLCGRPGLEANLEQLSVFCSNVDISARYFLESLTESETKQYLRFRLGAAGLSHDQHEDIFTDGAVDKIFHAAQGNIRMINILADESLQVSYSEKSFMVLLDHVDPESKNIEQVQTRVVEIYDLLRRNKAVMGGLAFAVILVLVLGLLLSGKEKKQLQPTSSESQSIEVISAPQTEVQKPPVVSQGEKAPSVEQPQAQVVEQIPPQAAEVKRPSEERPLNPQMAAKSEEQRDGEKLFRDRRGATASWVAGAYRGAYTIQLMMLASDQAQANITNMLIQDEYFSLKDYFYILRKKGSLPTLFVFYGMYDTMDLAREARNNMPVFLRKHHPYPLSISDALKKGEN